MAKSNLWNPGMLPSHVHVCVFVPMPQLHLGSPLTPFLPPPPHPTFRPSQVPSRMTGDTAMAHTPQFRQSLREQSCITFATAWITALARDNYFVSWMLCECCQLIVLLWKSTSSRTLTISVHSHKFSSFFKEITLAACGIFRQRNMRMDQGQSGNKEHTGLV